MAGITGYAVPKITETKQGTESDMVKFFTDSLSKLLLLKGSDELKLLTGPKEAKKISITLLDGTKYDIPESLYETYIEVMKKNEDYVQQINEKEQIIKQSKNHLEEVEQELKD
jgi:hypothetical protein